MSTSRKPLSSSYQQQSSFSGSSDLPLNLGGHKWLRLLLLAIVLYLALLPLWWYLLGVLTAVTGVSADWIYHFFDPHVAINPDGKIVTVVVTASDQSGFGGQTHTSS